MAVTIRQLKLKPEYFDVNGSSLERVNLFNQSTTIIKIDPTVVNPIDSVPDAVVDSLTEAVSGTLSFTAVNQLDSSWTSGGWDVSTDASIEREVRSWILRNLNDSSHFSAMAGRELELHTVWMRGNVEGQNYTLVFVYHGNAGPILANPLVNTDISDYMITELNGGTVVYNNSCLTLTTTSTGGSTAIAAQDYTTEVGTRYHFDFEIVGIQLNLNFDPGFTAGWYESTEGIITHREDAGGRIRLTNNNTPVEIYRLVKTIPGVTYTASVDAYNITQNSLGATRFWASPGSSPNQASNINQVIDTSDNDTIEPLSFTFVATETTTAIGLSHPTGAPGVITEYDNLLVEGQDDPLRVEVNGVTLLASEIFNSGGKHTVEFIADDTTTNISWQPNNLNNSVTMCPISMTEVFGPYLLNEDQSILTTEDGQELMLE